MNIKRLFFLTILFGILTNFIFTLLPKATKAQKQNILSAKKEDLDLTAFTNSSSQFLDEILIKEKADCALITVKFNLPLRYVNHFPFKFGEELRIKITLPGINPQNTDIFSYKESMLPPPNNNAALSEIDYEGDLEGGPFLTLYFFHKMAFKVKEGKNNRSIKILVKKPEETDPCFSSFNW